MGNRTIIRVRFGVALLKSSVKSESGTATLSLRFSSSDAIHVKLSSDKENKAPYI